MRLSNPDVFEYVSDKTFLVHDFVRWRLSHSLRLDFSETTEFEFIINFLTVYKPVIDIFSDGPG